jgi:hypothetical protein
MTDAQLADWLRQCGQHVKGNDEVAAQWFAVAARRIEGRGDARRALRSALEQLDRE